MAKEDIKLKFNLSRALCWGGEDGWPHQAIPLQDLLKPLFKSYGNYAVVRLQHSSPSYHEHFWPCQRTKFGELQQSTFH